jgi:Flp pilus assembly pilin Flp
MAERLSLFVNEALIRLRTLDFKREEGQGVTEYGIVLAFVAVALAAVLILLKNQISDFINKVGADLARLPAHV